MRLVRMRTGLLSCVPGLSPCGGRGTTNDKH